MRNRFDEQLRQLKLDMIRMSSLCETAITVTMQNMLSSDQVYTLDDSEEAFQQLQNIKNTYEKAGFLKEEIDQMERQVENQCMKLLLHQQPVAKDLRVISAAMKMIYGADAPAAHAAVGGCGGGNGHRQCGCLCAHGLCPGKACDCSGRYGG